MSYIVKVPEDKIEFTDKTDSYFWFIVTTILNTHAQQLKGLDLLDFGPVWNIVKMQKGQKTLAIKDDRDYKKIKELVEQNNRWFGVNATELGIAVIEAFQKAEHTEEEESKGKK